MVACIRDGGRIEAKSNFWLSTLAALRIQIAVAVSRAGGEGDLAYNCAKQKTPPLCGDGVSLFGTSGRTRTGTLLRARDFESRVSTNSTTLAFR